MRKKIIILYIYISLHVRIHCCTVVLPCSTVYLIPAYLSSLQPQPLPLLLSLLLPTGSPCIPDAVEHTSAEQATGGSAVNVAILTYGFASYRILQLSLRACNRLAACVPFLLPSPIVDSSAWVTRTIFTPRFLGSGCMQTFHIRYCTLGILPQCSDLIREILHGRSSAI